MYEKDFVWNPATCNCENENISQVLWIIQGLPVIKCVKRKQKLF